MQAFKQFLSSANKMSFALFALILIASTALWLSRLDSSEHGLARTHTSDNGYSREFNWLWMTIEGDEFTNADGIEQVNRVHMQGYVWFNETPEQTWRIAHTGNVVVTVDDTIVFEVSEPNHLRTDEITFAIDSQWASIQIDAQVDINTSRTRYPYRTEFGIYEQGLFGRWSLIPPHRLIHISPDTLIDNSNTALRYGITQLSRFIMALCILGLIAITVKQHNLRLNRNTGLVLGIVLLSLTVRFVVMAERFYSDPFFHFIVPAGDDNYVLMGQQLLSGDYDLAGTFWPSAPIIWFASVVTIAGSQVWKIYIANILLSGLATAAVTVGAWQAFDNRRVAILSGLLFALYPPLIFYQVTAQSVVLDAALASFALLFGIIAIKHDSFSDAAVFGIMISLGGMSRGIALLLGAAFFIALLIRKPMKGIQLTVVAAIFSLLTLLPQDWANYSATGELSLIPYSNGQFTLYSGNNRDADGIWTGRGAAWEIEALTDEDWTGALIEDFQQDPIRMIELNIRKLSMFWNNFEYVSNVNYGQQGIGKSRLIATLSLNGYIGMAALSFFVWIGMVQLITERKRENWFIICSICALIFGTILFVLAGRLRVPVMPFLVVAAAVGISSIWDAIANRKLSARLIAGIGIAVALSFIFPYLDYNLPRKSYVSVPETAIQRDYLFNNEIRLLGFDPIQSDYEENGYFYLSLYWEILSQPTYDYRVIVELADENGRFVGVDTELGSITYPIVLATDLQVGGIIQEGYLLELPENLPNFAHVNVGIYTDESDELLIAPDGQLVETPLVSLFDIGFDEGVVPIDEIALDKPVYDIGTDAALTTVVFTPVLTENSVRIESLWVANQQIYENYVIFIQLLDENGELIASDDSPYLDAGRSTSSLRNGYYVLSREIPLPDDLSGIYQIVMGIYEFPSIERLLVINHDTGEAMTDNLIPIGEITIDR